MSNLALPAARVRSKLFPRVMRIAGCALLVPIALAAMPGRTAATPAPLAATSVLHALASEIIDLPAPFKTTRCEVAIAPGNQIDVVVGFQNRDPVRTPARFDETVALRDVRGLPIFMVNVPRSPPFENAAGLVPNPMLQTIHFRRLLPDRLTLANVSRISCVQHAALFSSGGIWLRVDQPPEGWDQDTSGAGLFERGRFLQAE